MFWGNLLGKDTPAGQAVAYLSSEFVEVEEFVNAVKAKQAELKRNKTASRASEAGTSTAITGAEIKDDSITSEVAPQEDFTKSETDTVVTNVEPDMPIKAEVQKSDNAVSDKNNTESDEVSALTKVPVVANQDQVEDLVTESQKIPLSNEAESLRSKIDAAVIESETKQTFVSQEIERQLENVNDQGRVLTDAQRSDLVKANWILARKSFYQRNYDLSEKNYQKVIDSTEDNFDAYGELGNVYFNQGKKQLAATAYFEAAAILVRKGQINRARGMVSLLNLLNKDKANELQKLINTGMS